MLRFLLLSLLLFTDLLAAQTDGPLNDYHEAYFRVDYLNQGLGDYPENVNLTTPRSSVRHFIVAARDSNYARAAFALNLNLLPTRRQAQVATDLAEKLHYVIRQRVAIDWSALPNRPDGQVAASPTNEATAGQPQRAISFGAVELDGRTFPLQVERVKTEDGSPVWVISAATVERIEDLYAAYAPSEYTAWIPAWARTRVLGMPAWKIVGILLMALLCYLLARLLHTLISRLLARSDSEWAIDLRNKIATPLSVAVGAFLFYLSMSELLSIAGGISPYLYSFLLVVVIGCVIWLITRVVDYAIERITETQVADVSDEENLESRRLLTYLSVARWVITFIVIAVGIGLIISQFPQLKNLGLSLVASAGIATIIIGIAAQSTLGNIIAGLQIAITRPARIGDSIITSNGEYGTVEDIRFTYLVVKTWDARRLVIPLKYFIDHPFQNWSMNDPHMLKPIVLHVNFGLDVDRVREKFVQLCKANENYDDKTEPSVQVVDSDKEAMKVRCVCSAKDSSSAWTLHVELREAMIKYLAQLENDRTFPRERVEML